MDGISKSIRLWYSVHERYQQQSCNSLSRYYQSDTWKDIHPSYDFVNADLQLDPEGEDLPWNRMVEIHAIEVNETQRRKPLRKAIEERGLLAEELDNIPKRSVPQGGTSDDDNPTLIESLSAGPKLRKHVEKAEDFLDKVQMGYQKDPLFSKIILEKERHMSFRENKGLLYSRNRGGHEVLCIPVRNIDPI